MAQLRKEYVDKHLPEELDPSALCERAIANANAWPDPEVRDALIRELTELSKNRIYIKDSEFRRKVAYLILDRVGRGGLHTLLSPLKS